MATLLVALALGACGVSSRPNAGPNSGGTGGAGASAGSANAGRGGSGASAGSANAGRGGSAESGGGGQGSAAEGGAGAGQGGAGGSSGSAGSGSGPAPSAGCGKANPVTGARQISIAGFDGLFIVSVPSSYDAEHPYPLGFAFHGRNRNHANCQSGDCAGFQTVIGEEAVLVYMQSLRTPSTSTEGGWEGPEERDDNADFFDVVLGIVENEYCVDERRVFVAGTSSGASFSNLLACRFGDRLLAAGPVSGSLPEDENCLGTPAAVVIHGIDDPHVPFASGEVARNFFVDRNGCSTATEPPLATMHADIRAKRDAQPSIEDEACVDYQACGTAPVRWCEHSYGGYDGSTHGWPPSGGQLIWDFVRAL
jgi:poly(3-hydroxybutyrate) depolymerase